VTRAHRPTVGQHQILLAQWIAPDSTWHNVPLYATVAGPVDVAALREAVAKALWRHEALRTAFHSVGDDPVAEVGDRETEVALRDLSELPDPDAELARLRDAELRRPFDPASGLLARATLVRLGDKRHELVLTLHHVAVDGHSLTVLQNDILRAYRGEQLGEPTRFGEFATWHNDFAAGEALSEQLAFWRAELAGTPEPPRMPFLRSVASPSRATDRVDFELPDELATAVRDLAARQRATPFMVLLTAFGVLVRRYTGADDFVVGTPFAGRERPEVEDLVGYLVNMMPLRLRLGRAHTWLDALKVVRNTALDAYENSAVPFAQVAEGQNVARSAGAHPMFQIAFATPPALTSSTVDGVAFEFAGGTSTESLLDLETQVYDTGERMFGYLKYRTELFAREHIARLVEHFLWLTGQLVADPERNLADVAVLLPEERQRVVAEWNDTVTGYPRDATLVELAARWVADTPDAPASRYGADELTYRELDERANRLANHLRGKGVGRVSELASEPSAESRVGICAGFGAGWAVAALAVVKAGGAYVPLDPSYPPQRLEFMCQDSGVALVLVQEALRGLFKDLPAPVVVLDGETDAEAIAGESPAAPTDVSTPGGLAYVMYTSGSTGRPKGVGVTHRNIVRLVKDTDYVDLGPGDSVAQVSNLSFDAATFELWGALLNGARLVGIPKDDLLSAPVLAKSLRDNGIDVMFLTTAVARQLAVEAPETVSSLRCLLFGGESADARTVAAFLGVGVPDVRNVYGPTETTTFATMYPAGDIPRPDDVIPIGRPIANTTVYLLDEYFQPVGPGRIGEICIGGDGVARGYLGRPDLTAEKFIPDPFGRPGDRLYRTGDLGRYRPDGTIEFLGRADRQVKIRGFRIEPGEVENCLHETGRVREVTVQVRRDAAGEPMLVGYVVPGEPELSMDELTAQLRETLPAHLVPAALVRLESLPVTANGKLDTAELPDPTVAAAEPAEATTETERLVLAIWRAVLDRPDIGVHDDFFLLGGHSIKAGQVMTRVRAALEIRAPLRLIFDNPTVATLSQVLEERAG
jgi:amino acid adenylation domain-containing protein